MLSKLSAALLVGTALATPADVQTRQNNCPSIHVFGARETTASPGFGTAGQVVNLVLNAHPGATSEAIDYPATGDNQYNTSVQKGVKAVTNQVTSFVNRCPNTKVVLVGYSQGAQIIDDAMCGGGDPNMGITDTAAPISSSVGSHVKAMIWMGNPRHTPGASYNKGTSNSPGFDPRPSGQTCSEYANLIQSYCDQADPYCSNGNDGSVHQSYGKVYGQAALQFVNSKLN
ncbi:acetylxylan esterase precursor [Aspergillus steynii IBT 23096]|uniref:Acetylxylan esterase n=1 Tax=Aspergillus steynii IBT 23096 TaxID=1392250 RepID=A0A2I2GK36_9EURO|nr:acetylxylan esterase precursor [Aspergillus steynii IBT 23096]PLB53248.1 acetylxylan esterase precursor [Aspergillus steynii IBT 23096]